MYRVLGADQKEYGPVSAEHIRQWIAERRLNAQSLVMGEGAVAWKPLSTYPEFAASLFPQVPGQAAQPTAPGSTLPSDLPPPTSAFGQPSQATNNFALLGLIMGILAVLTGCCGCCYGIPFNILGLVFSVVSLNQIKERQEKGKEMAIAGLVLSGLGILLAVLAFILSSTVDMNQMLNEIKGKL